MKKIHTNTAPQAIGPYVQGNISNNLFFSSGQIPLDPNTGNIVGKTIEEQTQQVMKNIAELLLTAGSSFDSVIKTTCFLKNMDDFNSFNEIYATFFTDNLPARSAVEVARLPKDVLIEIEIIAEVTI